MRNRLTQGLSCRHRLHARQAQASDGSTTRAGAVELEAAEQHGGLAGQGQPQPGAAFASGRERGRGHRQPRGVHACARVLDGDQHAGAIGPRAKPDVPTGLERVAPLHRGWNGFPDGHVDGATLGYLGALDRAGARVTLLSAWPTSLLLAAQALLGVSLAEGVRYGFHVFSHRPGVLWRWHRVHHQPRRMYALNGPRLHPGNHLWVAVANIVPMLLLGARLEAVVLAANVTVCFVLSSTPT